MEKRDRKQERGTVLLIALMMVTFLGALAVAVMDPVSTSSKVTDYMYKRKMALMIADSVAERVKYHMCQTGAEWIHGTSAAVENIITAPTPVWAPEPYADHQADIPGVTYPRIDQKVGNDYIFNPDLHTDGDYPNVPGMPDVKYIAYTETDAAGNARSYVSADFDGEIVNIRVSYHRTFATEVPHLSYFHAAYMANWYTLTPGDFKFLLENEVYEKETIERYRDWLSSNDLLKASVELSSNGCINIKGNNSKGFMGFKVPNGTLNGNPRLGLYVNNVPGKRFTSVKVHLLPGPMGSGFYDPTKYPVIGSRTIDGNRVKKDYVDFELPKDVAEAHAGGNMYLGFSYVEASSDISDNASAIHFKVKGGKQAFVNWDVVTTETVDMGADAITGDVYVNGNADVTSGDVEGNLKTTYLADGEVTGTDINTGEDYAITENHEIIEPPDLSRPGDGIDNDKDGDIDEPDEGEWYASLEVNDDGTKSTNPDVITDGSDGVVDGTIAGIITRPANTGENQPYMDDIAAKSDSVAYVLDSNFGVTCGPGDPTYDYGTDSVIVPIPQEYNNKAIYVPGDFWIDILNPTDIDFRAVDKDGNIIKGGDGKPVPVNLTFVVEGDTYMTDGINRGITGDTGSGIISVVSLKRDDGTGGNVYYGDPASGGVIDPINSFLYAENDFKWFADAKGRGDFDIKGNMTAGGVIDLSDRAAEGAFRPIDVKFDDRILSEELRSSLPMLPKGNTDDMIPGSPFQIGGYQYLD